MFRGVAPFTRPLWYSWTEIACPHVLFVTPPTASRWSLLLKRQKSLWQAVLVSSSWLCALDSKMPFLVTVKAFVYLRHDLYPLWTLSRHVPLLTTSIAFLWLRQHCYLVLQLGYHCRQSPFVPLILLFFLSFGLCVLHDCIYFFPTRFHYCSVVGISFYFPFQFFFHCSGHFNDFIFFMDHFYAES